MGVAAVPWRDVAWRQYRLERRMFWRNPSAAFFGVVLPLGLLAIFGAVFAGRDEDLDVIVPGIAGMSVMSATFTSLAYNLTTLRERGILKRLRGTPLPTSAYLAGLAGQRGRQRAAAGRDRARRRPRAARRLVAGRLVRAGGLRRARA